MYFFFLEKLLSFAQWKFIQEAIFLLKKVVNIAHVLHLETFTKCEKIHTLENYLQSDWLNWKQKQPHTTTRDEKLEICSKNIRTLETFSSFSLGCFVGFTTRLHTDVMMCYHYVHVISCFNNPHNIMLFWGECTILPFVSCFHVLKLNLLY